MTGETDVGQKHWCSHDDGAERPHAMSPTTRDAARDRSQSECARRCVGSARERLRPGTVTRTARSRSAHGRVDESVFELLVSHADHEIDPELVLHRVVRDGFRKQLSQGQRREWELLARKLWVLRRATRRRIVRYLRSFALRLGTEIGFGTQWEHAGARPGGTQSVLADGATGPIRGRPGRAPARQPRPRLLRPSRRAARRQPRLPRPRTQTAQAQLPHTARTRRPSPAARLTDHGGRCARSPFSHRCPAARSPHAPHLPRPPRPRPPLSTTVTPEV